MILRLSSNAQRAVVIAVSFAVAVILSYFSIRNALAAHYAGLQTLQGLERAVHLEPTDPQNWYLLGRYWQYNLEDPDASRAIHSYLTALSLNPASWEIRLDLATVYESEGNLAAAGDAFEQAKKIYPLSAEVHWRYGNFLLRQGEREPAAAEMRFAIVADPKRGAEAFSRALRAGFDIDTVLDRVLPPISVAYIDIIRDQAEDKHTANALKAWDRLASLRPRISLYDSFPLVGALMTEKRIGEASRVWDQAVLFSGLAHLPNPQGSVLWDGGFESNVRDGAFSWLISQGYRNAQFGIDTGEKHSGNRSLRIIFDGKTNAYFSGICHYVPVKPSTAYLFSGWVKTRSLSSDQGIRFQLHPLGTPDTSSAFTPEVHGSVGWTLLELPWSSTKDVQELQLCIVRLPSQEAENKIRGIAWVDDVALVPQPAEHARP